MLQLVAFFLFLLLCAILLGLLAGIFVFMFAIITRVWPNYITPWLDKHFGESDW